ncbi:PHB depolymerase family esterase [Sphingobium sp. AS12]|uniref:extracellular catalytic domain type 1 short-chain-length polyhydroxyalkanoate depolymerase n=1 Tax=Sphingobium sp. AS12 TaxID=2849495 RepID=UPI001C31D618|nr:PHB depolymerase family esterase [Sphingobium sp. AS12]MBV2148120.1 PHB depolymerase family esterase [Sphingobium sp. AS12]
MRKLSTNIARLMAMRTSMTAPMDRSEPCRLQDVGPFGSNPGALKAKCHIPPQIARKPALVVILHGCTQTADGYDRGAGWSQLADEHGFILLFPEQQRANNPNLCFNWFSPADNKRDRGEALSIRQMIEAMIDTHGIDRSRMFVTGLSAGGAMTSILLASYPELFAGGAIIAGLPFGAASNVPQALEAMRAPGQSSGDQLGDRVRNASDHAGPWPRVSVWHGAADPTVNSGNADAILAQWLSVHALDGQPSATQNIAAHRHRIWNDATGRTVVEDYRIADMGHGTPLATTGDDACGTPMPHMLEAGISSTRRIAASWGLLAGRKATPQPKPADILKTETPNLPMRKGAKLEPLSAIQSPPTAANKSSVQEIIEDALRTARLMR